MGLTGAEKAKCLKKIKELGNEIGELRKKLASEENQNGYALSKYGSELCAHEMISEETAIRNKITSADFSIALLNRYLKGLVDISEKREARLLKRLGVVKERETACKITKKEIERKLTEIEKAKDLLK